LHQAREHSARRGGPPILTTHETILGTLSQPRVLFARMDASVQEKPYHTIGRWGRGRVRPITLTPRDLDCLYALFTHGVLSSDMLRALVAPEHSQRAIGDPNESVDQPEAQQRALNSYRSNLIYEINERGVRAFVDSGRIAFDDYILWNKLHANFKPFILIMIARPAMCWRQSNWEHGRPDSNSFLGGR
jgi:hypothetical protein